MKIFIQGFKSIRDGQFIALGRKLTFLVGPNSAGKSVLMLALDRLKGNTPDFELDKKLIYRNPNKNDQIAGFHSLGVEWNHASERLSYMASYNLGTDLDDRDGLAEQSLDRADNCYKKNKLLNSKNADLDDLNITKNTSTYLNSSLQGSIEKPTEGMHYRLTSKSNFYDVHLGLDGWDSVVQAKLTECASWQIDQYRMEISSTDPLRAKMAMLEKIKSENHDKLVMYCQYLEQMLKGGVLVWNSWMIKNKIQNIYKGKDRQRMLNVLEHYDSFLIRHKNKIVKKFEATYPGKLFEVSLVSADRVLPASNELEALIDSWMVKNIYHELMVSSVNATWSNALNPAFAFDESKFSTDELMKNVNNALSDNLFTDNGYQIQVDSKILASKRDWDDRLNDDNRDSEQPTFFCKISLKDSHGRMLGFNDVGSGIGYVLPVLIESFRQSNIGKVVFLQQPELHLHPALQASLTDVLIEASSNKRIVAETHSEHMILRALKRIRQTTNNAIKDPNLKLTPEDIAVNYFEPLPDGSTRVHILRVSEDGDFLDRWPNGFFAERDQELFDE